MPPKTVRGVRGPQTLVVEPPARTVGRAERTHRVCPPIGARKTEIRPETVYLLHA